MTVEPTTGEPYVGPSLRLSRTAPEAETAVTSAGDAKTWVSTGPAGVLGSGSNCVDHFFVQVCDWHVPSGRIVDQLFGAISKDCTYDPTPGSTSAWRYGCGLAVNPNLMIDNRPPWSFHTRICVGKNQGIIIRPLCRDA